MADPASKLRSGTAWILASKVSNELGQFVIGIVLARLLVPEDFGLVATVGIFTGIAGYFSGAGTGQALVRAQHAEPIHFRVVFTLQLAVGLAILLLLYLCAPLMAGFFGNPLYEDLLRVSALSFLLRPFANVPGAKLNRDMRFRDATLANLGTLIVASAMAIALAIAGFGPWSLIYSGLTGGVFRGIALCAAARWWPSMAYDRRVALELGGYGFKAAANDLLEFLRGQAIVFVLSKARGPGEVGLFTRASGLRDSPMRLIGAAPYQPVLRVLSTLQDDLDTSRYLYFRSILLVSVYTMPFYVGFLFLAEPLVLVLYGEKWRTSGELLRILACGGIFSCIMTSSGAVLAARNRLRAEITLNAIVLAGIVTALVLVARHGLAAVAWTVTIANIGFAVSIVCIAMRELRGSLRELVVALSPAVALNGGLFVLLWFSALLLSPEGQRAPYETVALMGTVGAVCYALGFLFLPIPALASEARRWKQRLGIARS